MVDFDFNQFDETDDFLTQTKNIILCNEINNDIELPHLFVGMVIDVMKPTTDTISFTNKTTQKGLLAFKNINSNMFSLQVTPKRIEIEIDEQIDISFTIQVYCNTRINTTIPIEFQGKKYSDIPLTCKTETSSWINPQHIVGIEGSKVIGRGSFGVVFEGIYNSQKCAIKRMNGSITSIERELRMLISLRNPYITQFYGAVYYQASIHFVMELAPCGSFDKLLKEVGYEFKMKVMMDVLKGIQFLHRNNVIHRDIKPANVLIFNKTTIVDVNAKLTDFGSCTSCDDDTSMTLGVGTVSYMAPEVIESKAYGFSCDIYSFGMMLYEVVSQRDLFPHMTKSEILQFIGSGKRPKQTPVIPKNVFTIIEGCWCHSPTSRYDVKDLTELLHRVGNSKNELMVNTTPSIRKHGCILSGTSYDRSISQQKITIQLHSFYSSLNSPKGYYYKAKEQLQQGEITIAIELLKKAVEFDFTPAMVVLASLYIEQQQQQKGIDLLLAACFHNDVQAEEQIVNLLEKNVVLTTEQQMKWYEYLSKEGNQQATYELALLHIYSEPKNLLKAERLLRQLLSDGYPKASLQLGLLLFFMQEDNESNTIAFQYFQQASALGDVDAINNCGVFYSLGYGVQRNPNVALDMLKTASAMGCSTAINNEGVLRFNGDTGERDVVGGAQCFLRAAEEGSKEGMFNAAICKFNGEGVDRNDKAAIDLLQQAAEGGDCDAQCLLANCYYYGRGVGINKQISLQWMECAAQGGNSTAMFNMGCRYYLGDDVAMNKVKAVEWYTKSATNGYGVAMCNLGRCYFDGDGVNRNLVTAAYWFEKAAQEGTVIGQYNLAMCYYYGDGVEESIEKALYWSKTATINGHAKAYVLYGKCLLYYYQFEQAVSVFEEAVYFNVEEAMFLLGLCYESGCGVRTDKFLSLKYFTEATSRNYLPSKEKIGMLLYESERNIEILNEIKATPSSIAQLIVGKYLLQSNVNTFSPSEGIFLLFNSAKFGNQEALSYLFKYTQLKDKNVLQILSDLYYKSLQKEQLILFGDLGELENVELL